MKYRIIGDNEIHNLERKILSIAIFGSSIITSLILIESIVLRFSLTLKLFVLILTSIFWLLYFLGRNCGCNTRIGWSYIFINYFIIYVDYLFLSGINSPAFHIYIILVAMMPFFMNKKQLIKGIIFNILLLILIYFGYKYFPNSILKNQINKNQIFEQIIETSIISAGMFIISYLVIFAYRAERKKVEELNTTLTEKNQQLKKAISEVKTLQGLIPICSNCKKIRNDTGYYEDVEGYIARHVDVDFSHTVCPECSELLYKDEPWYEDFKKALEAKKKRLE